MELSRRQGLHRSFRSIYRRGHCDGIYSGEYDRLASSQWNCCKRGRSCLHCVCGCCHDHMVVINVDEINPRFGMDNRSSHTLKMTGDATGQWSVAIVVSSSARCSASFTNRRTSAIYAIPRGGGRVRGRSSRLLMRFDLGHDLPAYDCADLRLEEPPASSVSTTLLASGRVQPLLRPLDRAVLEHRSGCGRDRTAIHIYWRRSAGWYGPSWFV